MFTRKFCASRKVGMGRWASRECFGCSLENSALTERGGGHLENALVVNWASVSEPHTSELNRDFSSNIIIIIIIICRTSFRIFLML